MLSSLVSVVIPAYNAAGSLGEAISSVLGQTLPEFELIVVDDGSTDATAEVSAGYTDNRLQLIRQSNRGQSAAINRGVQASTGRFIKIVDADDWLNPRHLESQFSALSDSEQAVSACRWGYFAQQADSPHVKTESTDQHYDDPLEWIVDSLSRDEGMMGGWRWLIPRTVWDRAGGYDERLSLNNDFHASIAILLASSGVRFAPDAVYSYRKAVSGALSATRSRKAMESALLTTLLGCQLLQQREDSPRIRNLCADRFQRWAYEFYPQFSDLAEQAELAVAALGGSRVVFPAGTFGRVCAGVFGWKRTRRLQNIARRLGWNSVLKLKAGFRNRRLS